jgi:hypothetical protein
MSVLQSSLSLSAAAVPVLWHLTARSLSMGALVFLLALAVVAAEPGDVPEVRALLVMHLEFKEKDRDKIAETALKLLASCSSSCPSSEKDLENSYRHCHLHVKFAKPREVAADREKVKVDELIVCFPTNIGGICVRIGTDYRYYTKFDCEHCKALHELLKAGEPQ